MAYTILLYYKYHPVENPEQLVEEHRDFCKKHTILGRIIIAAEGINGTCAGTFHDIGEYKKYVWSLPGFDNMWFKETSLDHNPFSSCKIKYKRELVALKVPWLDPSKAGKHVTPAEYHHLIGQDNVVVFDVRNKIEWQVGRFQGAVCPDIEFFRELPAELKKKKYQQYKSKKILLYCTGGIRCEKATHMFKEEGFKDVYQLEGGIYNYCSQYPHGKFEGTCFVFDERMQITWDNNGKDAATITDDKIISHCLFCQEKCSRIVNDERIGHHIVVCCQECDKAFDVSRIRYKKVLSTNS